MYRLKDAVNALLKGVPIKRITRIQKISKNTVKKYRRILNTVLGTNPVIKNDIDKIMEVFCKTRKEERFSKNFGWLEANKEFVDSLAAKCENYIVLIDKLRKVLNYPFAFTWIYNWEWLKFN